MQRELKTELPPETNEEMTAPSGWQILKPFLYIRSMIIRTKICGITNFDELRIAENSGTDAVGFLVGQRHQAVGFISQENANKLCNKANPFINTVIVTHLENILEICELANNINATAIQIHSDISLDNLLQLKSQIRPIKIICKVSVTDNSSIIRAKVFFNLADAILLDSIDSNRDKVGGTGLTHDWNISAIISQLSPIPIILAGGLNPSNVNEAVMKVKPWGVDCNTGVRIEHRLQAHLANEFVKNVKFS